MSNEVKTVEELGISREKALKWGKALDFLAKLNDKEAEKLLDPLSQFFRKKWLEVNGGAYL